MGIIGVITCEILELELAHLLAQDGEVAQVTVVENRVSARLIQAIEDAGYPALQRIPHVSSFRPVPSDQVEVVVRVLEFALHRKKETLQRGLAQAARELAPRVDALWLGYGLCGNALAHPAEVLDVRRPVFIPLDQGRPVDDCVGLLLGGRAAYYAEQCRCPGTFFMLPGWTQHWTGIFREDFCGADLRAADPALARRMFVHYQRALLVLTPVLAEEQMRQDTAEFCRFLGLRSEVQVGTLRLLAQAWAAAKASLAAAGAHAPPSDEASNETDET